MTFFQEIEWQTQQGGVIDGVLPKSAAARAGVQPGDILLAINGEPVEDVIDVLYYGAEDQLTFLLRRDGQRLELSARRAENQSLGLEFAHPTFDTDIRRCNNLCEFCFVLQMAPKFRRTLYIKDDDYRYSFLFGHYVTLTNLSDHDWWRIETMRLSPLYISVHVTDLEKRRQFLRNPDAPDILTQLRWLAERGIEMHTQLVIVPGFNDGEWLRRSVAELASLWPAVQTVSVVPVGLTKQHKYSMRPHTVAEAAAMLDYVTELQAFYEAEFDTRFVFPTDEWFLVADRPVPDVDYYEGQSLEENGLGTVRRYLDDFAELREEIAEFRAETPDFQSPYANVTLVTAALFGRTLARTAAEFSELTGQTLHIEIVENERFGSTITVAGLLLAGDVINHLLKIEMGDLVVLPRVIFDHPDVISLDDLTPQEVANRLDRPVLLADSLGDVWDALIDQPALLYKPGQRPDDASLNLRVLNDDDLDSSAHQS